MPNRCVLPVAMSAPNSAGDLSRVSPRMSATATRRAPARWIRSRKLGVIVNHSFGRGVLHKRAKNRVGKIERPMIADHDLDSHCCGARLDYGDGLRMATFRDKEPLEVALVNVVAHAHRFRRRGPFIQQRRVGDVHPGQVIDHRLEVQRELPDALARFRAGKACIACTSRDFRECCAE